MIEQAYFNRAKGIRAAGPTKLRSERCFVAGEAHVEARFGRYSAIAPTRARAVELLRERAAQDGVEVVR